MVRSELTRAKSQNSTSSACRPSSLSTRTNGEFSHSMPEGNSGAGIWVSAGARMEARHRMSAPGEGDDQPRRDVQLDEGGADQHRDRERDRHGSGSEQLLPVPAAARDDP